MSNYDEIEDLLYSELKYEAQKEKFYDKHRYELEELEDLQFDLDCIKCDYENLENDYIKLEEKYEKLRRAYIDLRDKYEPKGD